MNGATGSAANGAAGGSRRLLTDSGPGRVLGALVEPAGTFRSIAVRPTWAAPLFVLLLLGTLVGWLAADRVDLAPVLRHQNEVAGRQLTEEQLAQQVGSLKRLEPFLVLFQGLVAAPAVYLLAALLLWVGCRMTGSEMGYRPAFAVTVHGMLPLAIEALLAAAVVWRRTSLTQDEARSLSFLTDNLAALAPEGTGRVALTLLGSVNLFSLWSIVLLACGLRLAGKVSRAVAVAAVLTVWILGIAVKIGLVAIAPG